jgi:hypothetical protein
MRTAAINAHIRDARIRFKDLEKKGWIPTPKMVGEALRGAYGCLRRKRGNVEEICLNTSS